MHKVKGYILALAKAILLGVLLLPKVVYASTSSSQDSIIDVPSYLISGWYKGIDKEKFDNTKWYRNTSFTVNVNPEMMWDRAQYDYNLFNFGLSLSKEVNPSSAFSVGMNFATRDKNDFYLRRYGLELGYIWNLTNFYYGLDRTRRYSLSTTTGLEIGGIKSAAYKRAYYGGYLGLRLSRTFSPHTSFFLEPRIGIYSDSYDASSNVEGFEAMASAHLGMNYKLSEMLNIVKPRQAIQPLHMKNWFVEMGGDVFLSVPKVEYVSDEFSYSDRINYGGSIGFGYRVNPLTAARARFSYVEDRYLAVKQYLGTIDLMISGTNMFLGENEKRYTDMALILGPLFQFNKFGTKDELHLSWGAETGLQFTRRITPSLEVYVEPRLQLVQDYSKKEATDSNLKKRWDMSAGLIYLYQKRMKEHHNRWSPLQNWHIQTLAGVQLNSLIGGHQIGSFDFSIGRNFGSLWSVRASVFSGVLESDEPDYDDSYNPMFVNHYGGRAEFVMNVLRMLSPALEDSRWNYNISAGMEVGRLTNHYNKDYSIVLGSQLQYRFSRYAWLTAGGRLEQPLKFEAKLPLSGHIGVQYDVNNEKRIDILKNYWRWYVQGDIGFRNAFFNMDNFAYGAAVGLNVTPEHGGRIEFIGTKKNMVDGTNHGWMSISPEYVYNITNSLLGEDDGRKVDIEFFSGLDFMLHKSSTKVGFNFGTQVNANLNNSISLFVEPRLSYQPFDKIIAPSSHDRMQYLTMLGIRYTHNRFYTLDESAYTDIWRGHEFARLNRMIDTFKEWHPFEKLHRNKSEETSFSLGDGWDDYATKSKYNWKRSYMHPNNREWHPMRNWYIQTLFSAQLSSLTGGHQVGSFDFTIGRNLGRVFSIRGSVFSGELESDEPNYDESYNPMFVNFFGGRTELVFNPMRIFTSRDNESRWNLNFSAGYEVGHLTNHYKNDHGAVFGSQLQYRATTHAWVTVGGRYENLSKFDAKLPLSGHIGFQYDLANERRKDISQNKWRWYIQGGFGFRNAFFNMDNTAYNVAIGLNFNSNHGLRLEMIDSKSSKDSEGRYYNWKSISPEYVFNLTNKLLGQDDKRRLDIELYTGLDITYHKSGFKDSYVGFGFGPQLNANISKSWAVFIEPRFTVQPWDKTLAPNSRDHVQYFTLMGIRYSHKRFKSMN